MRATPLECTSLEFTGPIGCCQAESGRRLFIPENGAQICTPLRFGTLCGADKRR